jgi:holo-[acyl-carrier protein] synthase
MHLLKIILHFNSSMIRGIGTDIIEIKRIEKALERLGQRFLDRLFTPLEQHYCKQYKEAANHFAGRFAAKEATVKALGTGISEKMGWLDVEVWNDPAGKPHLRLSDKIQASLALAGLEPIALHLSISHCKEYATAFVVVEV